MNTAILRSFSWFVQRVGWPALLSLSLLAAILGSLVAGLTRVIPSLSGAGLAGAALAGLLGGWALARSRLSSRFALLLLVISGIALVLLPVLLASPSFSALLGESRRLINELLARPLGQPPPDTTPAWLLASQTAGELGQALTGSTRWVASLVSGTPAFDPQAANLFWQLLLWGAGAWAGWAIRRWNHPLAGVLPIMILLAINLSFARAPTFPLTLALIATLLLLAWNDFNHRQSHWQAAGFDYAEGLAFDITLWSLGLSIILAELALLISYVSPQQALSFSRQWLRNRTALEQQVGEAFGLKTYSTEQAADDRANLTGLGEGSGWPANAQNELLPRAHLLGSGPELSRQPVMRIQVGLPAAYTAAVGPAPPLYWRARTYDIYTGRGWTSSQVLVERYAAGQSIPIREPAPGWPIEQQIQPVIDMEGQVFAAGQPLQIDQPGRLAWRSAPEPPGDFYAGQIDRTGRPYQVQSWLIAASAATLRQASREYPSWIAERYLALPAEVPERVKTLAQTLTAGMPDAYSQAKALESYLRRFPYSLQVPLPPSEQDVTDYFLFDLQRGYCDYYATAMAVLARAAGLPARLATGYAPGTYDPASHSFLVTAADAHSWTEIYFPGSGWVIFEPTAARPSPVWSGTTGAMPPPVAEATTPAPRHAQPAGAVLALLAILAIPAWLAWDAWRLSRLEPTAAIRETYRRLRQAGRWLGVPLSPAQTPGEFVTALSEQLAVMWETKSATILAHLYARSVYAPEPPGEAESRQALGLWRSLRARLWLHALAGTLRIHKNTGKR